MTLVYQASLFLSSSAHAKRLTSVIARIFSAIPCGIICPLVYLTHFTVEVLTSVFVPHLSPELFLALPDEPAASQFCLLSVIIYIFLEDVLRSEFSLLAFICSLHYRGESRAFYFICLSPWMKYLGGGVGSNGTFSTFIWISTACFSSQGWTDGRFRSSWLVSPYTETCSMNVPSLKWF